MMTRDENELFCRFIKMKPPISHGIESENAYKFIIDYHERLHKMGVVERYGVELVTFQFQDNTKLC